MRETQACVYGLEKDHGVIAIVWNSGGHTTLHVCMFITAGPIYKAREEEGKWRRVLWDRAVNVPS